MKKMGRPVKPAKLGERYTLGVRVSGGLKQQLERSANEFGHSMSAECELRLLQSFDREWLVDIIRKELLRKDRI